MRFRCDRGLCRWIARVWVGTACLLMTVPFSAQAADEFRLSNDFSTTYNDVSGPGDDQSSLTEGLRYLEIFNLYGNGEMGEVKYNFSLGAKVTDDPRNDSEKFSLTNMHGRFTNGIHTLTLGDTFEAFSQYSLNSAVKGASYRYADPGNMLPDLTLVYGLAYSRWDNMWGVDAVERQVAGMRLKQQLSADFWVALNGVHSFDHIRVNDSSLFKSTVYSLDWEYLPIPGLTIRGESALADTTEDFSNQADDDNNGYAHKIEAIGDGGPSRVSLEYERVSPEFLTMLGSATPDREKFKARWRYKYTKTVTMNFGFLWYRDNLDGDLAFRTDHYKPEVGVTVRRLFDRNYAVADLTYKYDRAYGDDRSTSDHFVNLGYRDRFGIFDSDTNLGVTFYDTKDSRNDDEFIYNTMLSTRHTTGDWVWKPSLSAGGWTLDNELQDTRDQVWEYALGLGVDVPSAKVTSTLKVGQNWLQKDTGTDSRKNFARLNVFYRPEFLSRLDYGMLYLRAFVNDFDYSVRDRDFRENSVTAGVSIQF